MSGLILALVTAAFFGWFYLRSREGNPPVPEGKIVFQDTEDMELREPLVSHELRLTGKPDYLIRTKYGLVPVEVKSRTCGDRGPYAGEVAQVVAYCLLVEDVFGEPVPHGILQFPDRTVRVRFTEKRREKLLWVLTEMRALDGVEEVARSHESAARCRGCGVRAECGEAAGE
jgi:CRISPR-associated exonuclease Cas4